MAKKKGIRVRKEINRLKSLGHGKKAVSRILNISKNTVRRYWGDEVSSNFLKRHKADWALGIDWTVIETAISNGQSLSDLYIEHYSREPAFSFSSFWREYRRRYPKINLVLHKNYPPGERLEIDYKGTEPFLRYFERRTKEFVQLELFGAVLCFSQKLYVEATYTQKQEEWLLALQNAFYFLGGVTATIGFDNAKALVSKAHRYDPEINPEMLRFCEQFGVAPIAAQVSSPTHKALMENHLGVFWRWVSPKIRSRVFFSKEEVNHFLWSQLDDFNNRLQKKYGKSRQARYLESERSKLKALPEARYEYALWQQARLHPDCHIQIQNNFYSVPYALRGKVLTVRISKSCIEVFDELTKVALHRRFAPNLRGHYQTDKTHLPHHHQAVLEFTPQKALQEAKNIGEQTANLVERLLFKSTHPLQYLRRIQGLLRMRKRYGDRKLEYGCAKINEIGITFPKLFEIEKILTAPEIVSPRKIFRNPNPYLRGQTSFVFKPETQGEHK